MFEMTDTKAKWISIIAGVGLVIFLAVLGQQIYQREMAYQKVFGNMTAQLSMNYSHAGYHVSERIKFKTMEKCVETKTYFDKIKNHPEAIKRSDDFAWYLNRTFVCEELS